MMRVRQAAARWWRVTGLVMALIWRTRPGLLMAAFLALAVAARLLAGSAHLTLRQAGVDSSFLLQLFWCWRVLRGGRISRVLLILSVGSSYAVAVTHLAWWWDPQAIGLLAVSAAQLALLLSPAAYLRTRPDAAAVPVTADVQATAVIHFRLRLWMLTTAALAGLILALALLDPVRTVSLPGCSPESAPARCFASGHGYPLLVQSSEGSRAWDWVAFVKDSAQWALISLSVMYLLWLYSQSRVGPSKPTPAVAVPMTAGGQ
jgi:hypothetical protein